MNLVTPFLALGAIWAALLAYDASERQLSAMRQESLHSFLYETFKDVEKALNPGGGSSSTSNLAADFVIEAIEGEALANPGSLHASMARIDARLSDVNAWCSAAHASLSDSAGAKVLRQLIASRLLQALGHNGMLYILVASHHRFQVIKFNGADTDGSFLIDNHVHVLEFLESSNQPELEAFLYDNGDEIAGTIDGIHDLAQLWHRTWGSKDSDQTG